MVDQEKIGALAAASSLARYQWKQRGLAPIGYIKGIAISYARSLERLRAGHPAIKFMAQADKHDDTHDALSWYRSNLKKIGLSTEAGEPALLSLYVLMTGLGMRESSGRHCEGRDRSASNVTSDTAEAGLFQQSYNSRSFTPHVRTLFVEAQKTPYIIKAFHDGVKCSASELACYGSGDGKLFQATIKLVPFFAVEVAGVVMRVARRHWGPLNRKAAECRPEAVTLFKKVAETIK